MSNSIKRFLEFFLGGGCLTWFLAFPRLSYQGFVHALTISNSADYLTQNTSPFGVSPLLYWAVLSLPFGIVGLLSPGRQGTRGFSILMKQCLVCCVVGMLRTGIIGGVLSATAGALSWEHQPLPATSLFVNGTMNGVVLGAFLGIVAGSVNTVMAMSKCGPLAQLEDSKPPLPIS